ncbi:hypothetical protein BCV69DRAFT_70652 [Microstroma glucosiphilum]|uniref:Uncharacterized protein n=1 Tax=Pseudomicrostroma glucosiphilum TaxID=1684307 RepID=A0A316TZ12_9BASI|nr:hypothetical protein BCV69DRAFT_70652 [Pseudomicrostroma glucosiphilum]PWN18367.1 hypothetical protein BCV69DRAFT_70652 [Pseudomicrostroma glucosiphilum]
MHGQLSDTEGGEEERTQRIKVAIRLDELLEDKKKLLDFAHSDEDQASLQKQLVPLYRASPVKMDGASGSSAKNPPPPVQSSRSSSPDLPLTETRRSPTPSKKWKLADDSPFTTPPASIGGPSRAGSQTAASPPTAVSLEDDLEQVSQGDAEKAKVGKSPDRPIKEEDDGEEGQGHSKHPVQSSKGVADQATGPEEALEQANRRAQQELEEQQEAQRKK